MRDLSRDILLYARTQSAPFAIDIGRPFINWTTLLWICRRSSCRHRPKHWATAPTKDPNCVSLWRFFSDLGTPICDRLSDPLMQPRLPMMPFSVEMQICDAWEAYGVEARF
ncbi:hypothetical protein M441DRAFT_420571 [Trichoderma asperellum CBS 433.97]|uniref:Uncharacterized protein n=1 Tax=Trichoderma asperellum (strain ATCC 204424 / CBS 433.97 / NBRC 101777) TaxID=1042311 RepID=A0A2T3Z4V4_TRIA4|nr:hypothetical protein M441DRAFT_420571 [Trichoderma asperellum CBS 433.97]PTB39824.1 hypothetical protein M441DRAFT_420571 [Trichoderma asperellum CBS 433.97]